MTILILSGVLGFLLASLIALFLAPPLWRRAVRITTKTLIQKSPRMIDDGQADRDQMRAEFAVTTRKMEVKIEGLKEVSDTRLIELAKTEKKRDRLQGKIESLQTTVKKGEEKIEKLNVKLDRLLNDIGKKSEQLTAQAERLARQTEMLNTQATALEANAYEIDAHKTKISDYADKEGDFSKIISKQDLELTELRSLQRRNKLSKKTEDTAHKRKNEDLNRAISEGLEEISELKKNLEARKEATVNLRQEVARNKEKINDLIREIRAKDEEIMQFEKAAPATKAFEVGPNQLTSSSNEPEPEAATPAKTEVEDSNGISPAEQRAATSKEVSVNKENSVEVENLGNGIETTPTSPQRLPPKPERPAHSTRPSGKKTKPMKASETSSLAERIRALQPDHPKSM